MKGGIKPYQAFVWSIISSVIGTTLEKGAETSIYLASSDEVKGVTGKYFAKCKPKKPLPATYDESLRKKLWNVSEELTGFSYQS